MTLPESIGDLIDNCGERISPIVTEVDADWIEAVAKDPGHTQKLDAVTGFRHSGCGEMFLHLQTQRAGTSFAMISIGKT